MIELYWLEKDQHGQDTRQRLVVRMQGVPASPENVRAVLTALHKVQPKLKPQGQFSLTDFGRQPVVFTNLDCYLEFVLPPDNLGPDEPVAIENPTEGLEFPMSGTVSPTA